MKLNWKLNQEINTLTIVLTERIESTNAIEVEEAVLEIYEQNKGAEIIFDAENLNYISSAGLRMLLKVRKMQSELKIVNVSVEVHEIFEVTGFTEILTIEKALREISIENCEVIGKGGHGEVIRLNGDTIVKLFYTGTTVEDARREQDYAKKAFIMGIPTAIPFDVVKCGDRIGLVFEMIDSDTLTSVMKRKPERFQEYAVKYANLLKLLHSTKVEEDTLSGTKQLYRDRINRLAALNYFTEKEIEDLHRINDAFADDTCIIHGDFHPKNIMVMNDELILIDMADITYGNALYDLGSMFLTHVTVSPQRKEDITGLPAETVDNLWKIFISVYLETTDAKVIELTMRKCGIFAVLKAAVALGFSPSANTENIINNVTNMVRERILANADGCVALLNM